MLARRYLISGRVQGVGYRMFAQRAASEAGIRGWVRNLSDGRVEAHAIGPAAALEDFEAQLRRGPALGEVRGVEAIDGVADAKIEGFDIR